MPAEVIATIHQLAVACKKYKGIIFTDKDGNIVDDNSNDDKNNTLEITGVNMTNDDTLELTGVSGNTPSNGSVRQHTRNHGRSRNSNRSRSPQY